MGDPRGFLTTPREGLVSRPVELRLMDWREVYAPTDPTRAARQAGRCMDCGIPFCHSGCPLGNLIPEWNDLVYREDWRDAADRLHATNNFPEFTGRLCPAPCEAACVVGIAADPVSIKQVELAIIDRAFATGGISPSPPARLSGKSVGIVGSGPAGLAAAQQLTRAGHTVAVYERADRVGGLLRYGIPSFKLEKSHLDRRLAQLEAEGTRFRTGVAVGLDVTGPDLLRRHDALVLATGAGVARDLPVPGRHLSGVAQAMDYLTAAARAVAGDTPGSTLSAAGRHVVVVGGGDTGADCVGTAHREGAASVTQLEIMPTPPSSRAAHQPWPTYPTLLRVSSAHEEGGERRFAVSTTALRDDGHGRVAALDLVEVDLVDGQVVPRDGSEHQLRADLVLLAMGFTGPETDGVVAQLGLALDARGAVARDEHFATSVPGVWVAGDAGRGQSLIVWAIAEGRAAAASVDAALSGASALPAPVVATDRPLAV